MLDMTWKMATRLLVRKHDAAAFFLLLILLRKFCQLRSGFHNNSWEQIRSTATGRHVAISRTCIQPSDIWKPRGRMKRPVLACRHIARSRLVCRWNNRRTTPVT